MTASYQGDLTHKSSSGSESLNIMNPEQAIGYLTSTVKDIGLSHGIANSLVAKLNAASNSLNHGNTIAASHQLQAFINEVNAQTGKKITSGQAQTLANMADVIISSLQS